MKNQIRCLVLFLFFVLFSMPIATSLDIEAFSSKLIEVEVKGAVEKEGVYTIEAYSTIEDLLEKLNLNENADTSSLNLTTVLKNNDVIVIGELGSQVLQVSINTASLEDLDRLPGVGEVIAQRIIDYRTEVGPFQTLEDLKNVKGIGDKTFEKLKDYITL